MVWRQCLAVSRHAFVQQAFYSHTKTAVEMSSLKRGPRRFNFTLELQFVISLWLVEINQLVLLTLLIGCHGYHPSTHPPMHPSFPWHSILHLIRAPITFHPPIVVHPSTHPTYAVHPSIHIYIPFHPSNI